MSYLVGRAACVPEGVTHELPGPRGRLDALELDTGFRHGTERGRVPVGLPLLLPHHRVETCRVLVTTETHRG